MKNNRLGEDRSKVTVLNIRTIGTRNINIIKLNLTIWKDFVVFMYKQMYLLLLNLLVLSLQFNHWQYAVNHDLYDMQLNPHGPRAGSVGGGKVETVRKDCTRTANISANSWGVRPVFRVLERLHMGGEGSWRNLHDGTW